MCGAEEAAGLKKAEEVMEIYDFVRFLQARLDERAS